MRNRHPIGPYSRTMPRLLRRSWGGGGSLLSEVTLYASYPCVSVTSRLKDFLPASRVINKLRRKHPVWGASLIRNTHPPKITIGS